MKSISLSLGEWTLLRFEIAKLSACMAVRIDAGCATSKCHPSDNIRMDFRLKESQPYPVNSNY